MLYQMAILLFSKFFSRTLEKWSFLQQSFSFSHINITLDKEALCMSSLERNWSWAVYKFWELEVRKLCKMSKDVTSTRNITREHCWWQNTKEYCKGWHSIAADASIKDTDEETWWDWPTTGYNAGLLYVGSMGTVALSATISFAMRAVAQSLALSMHAINVCWTSEQFLLHPHHSSHLLRPY